MTEDKRHPDARCGECAFFNRNAARCEHDEWQPLPRRPQNFACADFEPRDDEEGGAK